MVSERLSTLRPRVHMADRGRGTSQNVLNDLLAQMKPKQFQGGFVPDAGNEWVQSMERIFRAMGCGDVQRVTYASYMLANEAENWWEMTRRQMEMEGQVIVWGTFKEKFLQKYFPADLKGRNRWNF
ncbi:hypothetical protein Lal_00039297 [Lupinus albus]|nr:hypothetical protein Lal_00039297 [Lupinus albus]